MNIVILTPIYNDWESFLQLLEDLRATLGEQHALSVMAVDDASVSALPEDSMPTDMPVRILRLNTNLGHQRAIAAGMAYLQERGTSYDALIIMDSDGEDRAADTPILLEAFEAHRRQRIIFAERSKRSESLGFRLFYQLYKLCFFLLTGHKISFGNFSCLPPALVEKITHNPDAWNHYSGCVLKSRLPYATAPTQRGYRYSGESKMNLQSLVLHGLSSISVYMDQVSIRLLGASLFGIALGGFALVLTFIIRLFTDLAIPGWATYVSLMLLNSITLMFVLSLLGLLLRLNGRNQIQLPPARLYRNFISDDAETRER